MLLERVIRGGAPTGLGTRMKTRKRSVSLWDFERVFLMLNGLGVKKAKRKLRTVHSGRLKQMKIIYLISAL